MFSFPLKEGDSKTALKEKNSIVISSTMAEKYFGKQCAIGKMLTMNSKDAVVVTGVMEELPKNSSFQFEYLLPFESFFEENKSWLGRWGNNNVATFLMFREKTNVTAFGEKFRDEIKRHNERTNVKLFVQPYAHAYLYGDFENGIQTGGR